MYWATKTLVRGLPRQAENAPRGYYKGSKLDGKQRVVESQRMGSQTLYSLVSGRSFLLTPMRCFSRTRKRCWKKNYIQEQVHYSSKDRRIIPESKKEFLQQILPRPISRKTMVTRFRTGESGHMQESGVVGGDRWRHFMTVLLVCSMNGSDRRGN